MQTSHLLLLLFVVANYQTTLALDSDHGFDLAWKPDLVHLPFEEYCEYLHYPIETHNITTQDGYILTFYRIQAKNTYIQEGLPVIYLQHGLLASSDCWIMNDEPQAPAFMLANKGYDVWLGNNRGSKHSLLNINYTTNDTEFWQFTWQHMAKYDIPAAFAYIAGATKQKIHYIGHSEGTTQMFAALSLQEPIVMNNIETFIALGPVAYVHNGESPILKELAESPFAAIVEYLGINDFMPPNSLSNHWAADICTYFRDECIQIVNATDPDRKLVNIPRIAIYFGHWPAGTSSLNMFHWRQMVLETENVFPMYNYGVAGNIENYGQPTAPTFDLGNINIPVHLFVGSDDVFAGPLDATLLRNDLVGSPNVTFNEYPMAHTSFLLGRDMSFMNKVFAILKDNAPNQLVI
jgi:gastric triacylglycerol lipase